ncbi:hypothetical protein LTR24_009798 [Lithohypha guttulata]|uniref:Uncharacterized protein n=1 Tax=Lithohypha guttulata TaxID=1690604 RepID=A0ABR0JWU9_9EURO|nr:hypothetical protein LTR24_009798 [Lithohypha guttulata]
MHLTSHAEVLASTIRESRNGQQGKAYYRGQSVTDTIDQYAKVWRHFFQEHEDTRTTVRRRQVFQDLIRALLSDNERIIAELLNLQETMPQMAAWKRYGSTLLDPRNQQIMYAVAALDLITNVVAHAIFLAGKSITLIDREATLEKQTRAVADEYAARSALRKQEAESQKSLKLAQYRIEILIPSLLDANVKTAIPETRAAFEIEATTDDYSSQGLRQRITMIQGSNWLGNLVFDSTDFFPLQRLAAKWLVVDESEEAACKGDELRRTLEELQAENFLSQQENVELRTALDRLKQEHEHLAQRAEMIVNDLCEKQANHRAEARDEHGAIYGNTTVNGTGTAVLGNIVHNLHFPRQSTSVVVTGA